MPQPKFEHDCGSCTFLGTFEGNDLYYCWQNSFPTVIARYGKDGEYYSGLCFAKNYRHLNEAAKRAFARGLLSIDQILKETNGVDIWSPYLELR